MRWDIASGVEEYIYKRGVLVESLPTVEVDVEQIELIFGIKVSMFLGFHKICVDSRSFVAWI